MVCVGDDEENAEEIQADGEGGNISSLVYVECDDNSVRVVCAGEEKCADTSIMIGLVCKEVVVDGVGFEIGVTVRCDKEMVFSLVCGLMRRFASGVSSIDGRLLGSG